MSTARNAAGNTGSAKGLWRWAVRREEPPSWRPSSACTWRSDVSHCGGSKQGARRQHLRGRAPQAARARRTIRKAGKSRAASSHHATRRVKRLAGRKAWRRPGAWTDLQDAGLAATNPAEYRQMNRALKSAGRHPFFTLRLQTWMCLPAITIWIRRSASDL